MADIVKEVQELKERIEKAPSPLPRHFHYPAVVVKQAAELYKNTDWYIHGLDGSVYYHGEQIRPPSPHSKSVFVTALNEKIAAMELPSYLEQLQPLTPEQKNVYLTGEWGRAEEGEDHAGQ